MPPASANATRKMFPRLLLVLLGVAVVYLVWTISRGGEDYQWDFRTYYYAAQADADGIDPYDPDALLREAGGRYRLKFVYPPLALSFFRLWTALSYPVAFQCWLFFKLLLLFGLIFIWKRFFFRDESVHLLALFLFSAFSFTVYVDLAAGNISIVEQFLLWTGFAFLLARKPIPFCAAIILASIFKVTLIGFLIVLPFSDIRYRWRYLAGAMVVFLGMLTIDYLLDPLMYHRFFAAALAIEERGQYGNPSLYSLVLDLIESVSGAARALGAGSQGVVVYIGLVAAILGFTLREARGLRGWPSPDAAKVSIYLACLTYALVVPRMKTYSFILLLLPAFYVLRRSARMPAFGFLFVLLLLTVHPPLPVALPIRPLLSLLWLYSPLLLAFLVWGLLIHHQRHGSSEAGAGP